MKGYNSREEARQKEAWEVMRTQTAALINIQLQKGKRLTPRELFQFPWDRKQDQAQLSKEEAKAILARWEEH